MPTPMSAYVEAARKFGKVDPTDEKAIDQFFVATFPSLPPKKQKQVLSFLLAHEGPIVAPAPRELVVASHPPPSAPARIVLAGHTAVVRRFAGVFFAGQLARSFKPVAPLPTKRRDQQWQE
jgi:hypothetical protein